LKPEEDAPAIDYEAHVRVDGKGIATLQLLVDGLHCAACVWLIESVLAKVDAVLWARVNLTTRRLTLKWRAGQAGADALVRRVTALGYRLIPFDPAQIDSAASREERRLLRAVAVAGFAAANIMLLSVSVWAGAVGDMGAATRGLMHWLSALIAIPAVAYAGRPFFESAVGALAARRVNMDVPIALAILLATGMSLFETLNAGTHVYFDSAAALLFFLLIGRYLDRRARGRAHAAAEHLVALAGSPVTVLAEDGSTRTIRPDQARPGMTALVAAGERIGVDGTVLSGEGEIDTSLITGESMPAPVGPGETVFAGAVSLTTPLRVRVTAAGAQTLLAEIVALMEAAEQGRNKYVRIADRVARFYAPGVHTLGAATFLGWWLIAGAPWQTALLHAIAVLIITCPCALALAVPAVQVVASGWLLRRGILIKSASALERLARVDTIVFDKTGTLTEGRPDLIGRKRYAPADLRLAASIAMASRHPLARALVRAAPLVPVADRIEEVPGQGLRMPAADGEVRLGNRRFCGVPEDRRGRGPELWLTRPGYEPLRFAFADRPRRDAVSVLQTLGARYDIKLISGDRRPAVAGAARSLGIPDWRARCSPPDKVRHLEALRAAGRNVMMVGDGLNDAPALAAADVSLSPAAAADISAIAADALFQGDRLAPVATVLGVARRAGRLVRQNFAFAFLYNAIMIPVAIAGLASPLVAAIAMSSSSLVVVANALRAGRGEEVS